MIAYGQIESLDRGAGRISTPWQGRVAAMGERAHRRSGKKSPGFLLLGRQRISAGLSQFFVKRYLWPFGIPAPRRTQLGAMPIFPWTACKAVHFLFSAGYFPDNSRKKEKQ